MRTPASCYTASPRCYPALVPEPEYPSHMQVCKVHGGGEIAWRGHRHVFLSETLIGEHVGLEPIDERWYTIYFADVPVARFDGWNWTVHGLPPADDFYIEDAKEGVLFLFLLQ
jgi:putative transposase